MDYCESKSHGTLAAFIDFYCIQMVVGLIINLVVAFVGTNALPGYLSFIILLIDLVLVVVYHSTLASRTTLLSLGERIAGRIRIDREKKWINPYCKNRIGLYIFAFVVLILYGNSFDALFEGVVPEIGVAIGKAIGVALMLIGLIWAGKGRIQAILIPVIVLIFGAVMLLLRSGTRLDTVAAYIYVAISAVGIAIWIIYRRHNSPGGEDISGASESQKPGAI